jgi:hypothetical protein
MLSLSPLSRFYIRRKRTFRRSPIFPANGSIPSMVCRPPRGIVLDMDSSVSPTHGEQENSVWNGHYACTCYHPLFLFNQFGDLERCALRPGNVHSADGWDEVLKPVVARYRGKVSLIYFRADAWPTDLTSNSRFVNVSMLRAALIDLLRRERLPSRHLPLPIVVAYSLPGGRDGLCLPVPRTRAPATADAAISRTGWQLQPWPV